MSIKITIPEARLRYINHIYEASRYKNDPSQSLKYSAGALILKASASGQAIQQAFDHEVMNFHGVPQLAYGLTPCLLDGALKFPGDPFYADYWFLSMGRMADDGAPQVLLNPSSPVVDRSEIYPGCWVAISGSLYGYKGGRGGVNFDLFGVMKIRDDERIGEAPPDAGALFAEAGIQGTGATVAPVAPAPQSFGIPQGVNPPNVVPGVSYPVPGQIVQQPAFQPAPVQPAHTPPGVPVNGDLFS